MGKTAVDETKTSKSKSKKVSLKVPEKSNKKSVAKKAVAPKKAPKPIQKKKEKKTKNVEVAVKSPDKKPRKVVKPRKVRVLNDMPFRKFGKELARSYGVENMSAEAKETFDGLVQDFTDALLDRLFDATRDLNTVKDRHVTNVVAQEVLVRRKGDTNLVQGIIQTSQDVGQRYDELYPAVVGLKKD